MLIPSAREAVETPATEVCRTGRSPSQRKARR